MQREINTATVAALKSASSAVAVAIEAALDGITSVELPAIIAHADKAKADIDRLVSLATESANRATWGDSDPFTAGIV